MKRLDKIYNDYLILDTLKTNGTMSVPDIAACNRLSIPTVNAAIRQMEDQGMVVQSGFGESEIGRRPALWKLNGRNCFFVGIDFEPPVIRICVLDMEGQTVHKSTHTIKEDFLPDYVLGRLRDIIKNCIETELLEDIQKLKAICIGNPGAIDKKSGISVFMHDCPGWKNVPIVSDLENYFGCNVRLESVILYMTYVERDKYVKMNKKDFMYIALRTGVGAGLCINGELYNGVNGNAGHFGYIPLSNPLFDTPYRLEECSDVKMMMRRLVEYGLIEEEQLHEDSFSRRYYDILTDRADEGLKEALLIIDEIANYWAYGIASVLCLLDIPLCVFGGVISYINNRSPKVGDYFQERIREYISKKYLRGKNYCLELQFSQSIDCDAAYGAALYGYDAYFENSDIPQGTRNMAE